MKLNLLHENVLQRIIESQVVKFNFRYMTFRLNILIFIIIFIFLSYINVAFFCYNVLSFTAIAVPFSPKGGHGLEHEVRLAKGMSVSYAILLSLSKQFMKKVTSKDCMWMHFMFL